MFFCPVVVVMGLDKDPYIIDLEKEAVWQLTDNPKGYSALHPKFSHKGDKLLWAERYEKRRGSRWGHWRLKLADVLFDSTGIRLANIRNL